MVVRVVGIASCGRRSVPRPALCPVQGRWECEEETRRLDVLIGISEGKWYWPALGAVRRKYPRAAIDVVTSTRQAQLFAALPEVRQVAQTRPEEEYDLEISPGDRVEQRYSNEMLGGRKMATPCAT